MDYLDGPNIITRVEERGRGENVKVKILRCCTADFEGGRRGHMPNRQAASKIWKRKGNGFFSATSRRKAFLLIP